MMIVVGVRGGEGGAPRCEQRRFIRGGREE
jgi:hypothetical protein